MERIGIDTEIDRYHKKCNAERDTDRDSERGEQRASEKCEKA